LRGVPKSKDINGDEETAVDKIKEKVENVSGKRTNENVQKPDEDIVNEHKHNFLPLWMPALALIFIVLAYIYCGVVGLEVNKYRAIGTIGIATLFTIVSAYLKK